MIQKVLADAEQKQTEKPAVKHWLLKLKAFCYDAEDVLDEFETRALYRRARSTEHLTLKRKVQCLSSWLSNFIFQFKMAHQMKELIKRLDGINGEKNQFNLSSHVDNKTIVPRRETHSFVPPSNVIGRNKETESITELLIRSDYGGAGTIAVIPIIGMGGAGKTTLAELVYNDDKVKEHFEDNKIWLSMPVEFELKKIIGNILESLDKKEKYDSLEKLQQCLRSTIANKRFLFVMDDVWRVSKEDWEKLRDLLGGVSEGSKAIVTSRNESIASIMGTVPPLNLANLSREDSLTLFVNGFIQSSGNSQEPEEIGRQYLEELRSRSFFDVVEDAYPLQFFRMHDLIYELAISVAQTESSNMKVWTQDISPTTRHISFPHPSRVPKDELSRRLSKLSRVRTIICEGLGSSHSEEFFLETCISRFKHLRVLQLHDSDIHLLPSSVGGLKHLRYLHLCSNPNIKKLPKSVCELRNLQCLGLGGCEELEELPASIKNMISLRVLNVTTKQKRFRRVE
ncbi:hypothetical protein NL676_016717 [Syzygium grande]|nr:hypothetical protein NL676_016717 [Syzygium grande]